MNVEVPITVSTVELAATCRRAQNVHEFDEVSLTACFYVIVHVSSINSSQTYAKNVNYY